MLSNVQITLLILAEGGDDGGNIICEGTPEKVAEMSIGETSKYLVKELIKN